MSAVNAVIGITSEPMEYVSRSMFTAINTIKLRETALLVSLDSFLLPETAWLQPPQYQTPTAKHGTGLSVSPVPSGLTFPPIKHAWSLTPYARPSTLLMEAVSLAMTPLSYRVEIALRVTKV